MLPFSADIKTKDNFNWTPLHHACHAGIDNVVELLMSQGAKTNAKAMNGGTPLERAVESNRPDIVHRLVAAKANIRIANRNGRLSNGWLSSNC